MSAELLRWLQLGLGAAFAVAMLWLARWALFGDPARGRLRCPRCWYDLSYSFTLTCSECGHVARAASELTGTRRRWRTAALAVLAVTLVGLVVLVRAADHGWTSMAPTQVLLAAVPLADHLNGPVHRELRRRRSQGDMSDRQALRLLDRCVAGEWGARPPSAEWADKYGQLLHIWLPMVSDIPQAQQRLLSLPPRVTLTTAPIWSWDCPPTAQARLETWWPPGTECRLTITPRSPAGAGTTLRCDLSRGVRAGVSVPLPHLAPAASEVVVDVTIEQRAPAADAADGGSVLAPAAPAWRAVGTSTFTLPVRRLEPGAPPPLQAVVDDPEMDAIMAAVFRGAVVQWVGGRSPLRIRYEPDQARTSLMNDTAIGVVVEIVRDDGAVARRLRLWWLAGLTGGGPRGRGGLDDASRRLGWELPFEDAELLQQVNGDDGRWSMRVRGELAAACRAGAGTRYWAGELSLPLLVRKVPAAAPPPLWWIEP